MGISSVLWKKTEDMPGMQLYHSYDLSLGLAGKSLATPAFRAAAIENMVNWGSC